MFFVYAIISEKNKIYIGQTEDIKERLKRHNGLLKNKAKSYTFKNKGIWTLLYKEEFDSRQGAIKREKQLKSFRGREFLRGLIKNK